jgi:hypothetical protein
MKNAFLITGFLILFIISSTIALFAQERSPLWPRYKKSTVGKLYGFYKQSERKFIIEPQYKQAGTFSKGKNRIAPVQNFKMNGDTSMNKTRSLSLSRINMHMPPCL